jgi:predicted ArsR family transcriptional regulator
MRADRYQWTADTDRRIAAMYDEDEIGPIAIAERLGLRASSIRTRLTTLRKRGLVGPARGGAGRPCKPREGVTRE